VYENLNLREWPFRTAADENFASIWAGRANNQEQINRLIRKIQLFPSSGLYILWANFGMGKTHTLYHLRYRCRQIKGTPQIIPVYAVMPKRSTGFLELYREIVQGLPYDFLRKQLQKIGSKNQGSVALHPMFQRSPGVVKALLSINPDDIEASTNAMQWLAAQPGLSNSILRSINVNYRIKTPEDAINALSALTSLASYDPDQTKANRLLVMIDEYQRVGELRPKIASENNASLHTYFNQHPTNLQLILSFSCGNKENIDFLLSAEVKSRAEPKAIILDVLTKDEAVDFIRDLLSQFRNSKDDRWSFPFSPRAVDLVINCIVSRKSLTPRRLMLYFNHVLSQGLLDSDPPENGFDNEQIKQYLEDEHLGNLDLDMPGE
jgi:hypothetical protein